MSHQHPHDGTRSNEKTKRWAVSVLGGTAALAFAMTGTPAHADDLPLYHASVTIRYADQSTTSIGNTVADATNHLPTGHILGASTAVGSASSTIDNGGTVTVTAEVARIPITVANPIRSVSALADQSYVFRIDGPDTDAIIPVQFMASGGVQAQRANPSAPAGQSDFVSGGRVDVDLFGSGLGSNNELRWFADAGMGSLSGEVQSGLRIDQTIGFKANTPYGLTLLAGVTALGGNFFDSNARASADPVFTILGDFARNYRVVGVPRSDASIPSVPEPASWAMMVAGFGLVGAARRRSGTRAHAA